ncbi:VWA domain-containing protein [Mycolicibacterium rufum]|uniref:VWA domain-containing protein n=1 Tax=Mycolicibacterium rufum TaxID=318424 RepID=A0A9X2YD04_9MYCO|nr:vWA domain-containing protein [Mycolicibacterium rufum]KGI66854.1 von Willebrand factor A [Mycolicibacterium rufum]MCV7071055.1 VWA domain-containing protein [Mycolicibacterium rufum]ULP37675.1 VWA domain-containing protein [Mycolicibacterium rufum]
MAYTAEISRATPTCFVLVVDQSASMDDAMGGEVPQKKSQVVADAINRLLFELTLRCAKEEGVRDYFHIAVLGYGGSSVKSAFTGPLSGRDLVPISEIAESPARLEERTKKVPDGAGGLVEQQVKFPIWLDAQAGGGTPMVQALSRAEGLVSSWADQHPAGFPPVVLHLTDGESTDGDPTEVATKLRSQLTTDGNVLLFNLHVSDKGGNPISFPSSEASLPDQFSRLLFDMSSLLPSQMRALAASQGHKVEEGSKGFVYNADVADIVQFLEIGTRASDLR